PGRFSEQKLRGRRAAVLRKRGGHDAGWPLRVDLEPPGDDEALRPCPQPRHPPLLRPIAGHRQADRYGASGPESRTVFEEECPDAADGFLERSRAEQAVTGRERRRLVREQLFDAHWRPGIVEDVPVRIVVVRLGPVLA